MSFPFIITNAGRAAIVNAASTGFDSVVISEIALGSTYAAATSATTALANEVARIPAAGGGTIAPDVIHVTGSDSSSAVYSVRQVGLYTSTGILFAIYSQADPILTKASGTVALIAADLLITGLPAGSVTVGEVTFAYPQATETVKGVAELATIAETVTGTDDERIVTPKKLAALTSSTARRGLAEAATEAETITGTDAERFVTPASLAALTSTTARKGLAEAATAAEASAGTDTERFLTPSHLGVLASEFFKLLYPVGEIYITRREGNPATWLGFGTWQRHAAGKALVGHDPADPDFNAIDKTGGAKSITLAVGEIPSHSHSVNPPITTTSTTGAHTHQLNTSGDQANPQPGTANPGLYQGFGNISSGTTSNGDHSHTLDIPAFDSAMAGGGGAHSNLQPYIVAYVWKRIA